jgi:hypothetical protein
MENSNKISEEMERYGWIADYFISHPDQRSAKDRSFLGKVYRRMNELMNEEVITLSECLSSMVVIEDLNRILFG